MYMLGFGMFSSWRIERTYSVQRLNFFNYDSHYPEMFEATSSHYQIFPLLSISAVIGSIFFGLLTMKFGRKKPLLFMFIPLVVSSSTY